MKAKIGVLFLVAVIASAGIGVSYACVSGGVDIKYCPPCGGKFTDVEFDDNEDEIEDPKDVADVGGEICCCGHKIDTWIRNAYPGYEATISFDITNVGNRDAYIDQVCIENNDETAIEISRSNLVNVEIPSGETITGWLTVEVLDGAKQNEDSYSFKVCIHRSCGSLGHPRPVWYWKGQMDGDGLLTPEEVENYLDVISTDSNVFSFSGSQSDKFEQALNILEKNLKNGISNALKSQLLALWLNYEAGWTNDYTIHTKDGDKDAWTVIHESENALSNGGSLWKYWWYCLRFNHLN